MLTSFFCGLTSSVSPLLKSFSSLWSVAIAWGKNIDSVSPPFDDQVQNEEVYFYTHKRIFLQMLYVLNSKESFMTSLVTF